MGLPISWGGSDGCAQARTPRGPQVGTAMPQLRCWQVTSANGETLVKLRVWQSTGGLALGLLASGCKQAQTEAIARGASTCDAWTRYTLRCPGHLVTLSP
eukprot:4629696-Alexandrium_andersonii.AAC.1